MIIMVYFLPCRSKLVFTSREFDTYVYLKKKKKLILVF